MTPGASQNLRSAPQKQPMPNTACSAPCGKGGWRAASSTWCLAGTGIFCARPGSAVSRVGISSFFLVENHMGRSPSERLQQEAAARDDVDDEEQPAEGPFVEAEAEL